MLIDYPEIHQNEKSDHVWADCVRHCDSYRNFWFPNDMITSSHEISHGISSEIRNKQSKNCNAFYILDNKAIIIDELPFRKEQVNSFVPANLRASRYSTYLLGMRDWSDKPSYLIDEKNAYDNGAYQAIQSMEKGTFTGMIAKQRPFPRYDLYQMPYINELKGHGPIYRIGLKGDSYDWAFASLEFSCYSLAVLMATEKFFPKGLDSLRQDFVILWKRGWDAYRKCIKVFPWAGAASYEENFNNNQEMQHFVEKMALNEPDFSSI